MLDLLLTGVLIAVMPVFGFWRTWAQQRAGRSPGRMGRYVQSLALALTLSVVVIGEWRVTGRDWRVLGLGLPIMGWIGLGIAIFALIGAGMTMQASRGKGASSKDPAALDLLPVTTAETLMFVLFSIGVGFGWELLYRGYLMWALTPHLGVAGAMLLAAAAYGIAHGYRGAKLFAGSLVSALIFTLAYVLTQSLWWLAVLHAGLPLLALLKMRASSSSPPTRAGDISQAEAA